MQVCDLEFQMDEDRAIKLDARVPHSFRHTSAECCFSTRLAHVKLVEGLPLHHPMSAGSMWHLVTWQCADVAGPQPVPNLCKLLGHLKRRDHGLDSCRCRCQCWMDQDTQLHVKEEAVRPYIKPLKLQTTTRGGLLLDATLAAARSPLTRLVLQCGQPHGDKAF